MSRWPARQVQLSGRSEMASTEIRCGASALREGRSKTSGGSTDLAIDWVGICLPFCGGGGCRDDGRGATNTSAVMTPSLQRGLTSFETYIKAISSIAV